MATSDCLINILGREAVVDSRQKILSYFQKPVEPGRLLAVSPKNTEEVQQILKFSHEENIPVFTTYDTYFNESIASFEKGILIDFKLMNNIEKIDKKNLMVHVQRGVTFEQAAE